jgi:hypothetical protein
VSETAEFVVRAVLIGIGATVVMDIWTEVRKRVFNASSLDYALVGRWLGHLTHGQIAHERIAKAPPIAGEGAIGWTAHYAIGIAFAALLLAVAGLDWARAPSPLPALVVGLATIVAPFFVLQPALGAGFAASKTPNPTRARLQSAVTHTVFGIGLYISALLAAALV